MNSLLRSVALVLASTAAACCHAAKPPPAAVARIVGGFYQDQAKNCTSIAFIKAVLYAYDGAIARLFVAYHEQLDPDGKLVAIDADSRAGHLHVDGAEVARADAAIAIQRPDPALAAPAVKLYALIAKACESDKARCQVRGDGFDASLEAIGQGLEWDMPPQLLGLREGQDWTRLKGVLAWFHIERFTSERDACVAATPWHTFFVAGGYYDRYGTPIWFSHLSSHKGLWAKHAYCLGAGASVNEAADSHEHQDDDEHRAAELE